VCRTRSSSPGYGPFERELNQRSNEDIHERTRGDNVAVAIEHGQAFIQQLTLLAAAPLRCTCNRDRSGKLG